MADSYRALCTDFYVNQKLQVKLELPKTRETVLDLFERARRQFPTMVNFRRFRDELALESSQQDMPHRWLAVRGCTLRSGVVNAPGAAESYALHKTVLELAPTFLSISSLDIDSIELLYGFDLLASGNHDAIVLDALLHGSPLANLLEIPEASPTDFQPIIGMRLGRTGEYEVSFEVKTRGESERNPEGDEPISVYLSVRRVGPFKDVRELPAVFENLTKIGEKLVEQRLVPNMLVPIREAIGSGNV
ncbi:MAG TPA: hypothetical protein VD971_08735 [Phycisphaerales bacterium]|nr:hypothetical protein [Phycisphaerales bacterium]